MIWVYIFIGLIAATTAFVLYAGDREARLAIVDTVEIIKRAENNLQRVARTDFILDNQHRGFFAKRHHVDTTT